MKAILNIHIQGVKGENYKSLNNKGCSVSTIDNKGTITIDSFEGQGNTYRRRLNSLIEIQQDTVKWTGTFEELINKLTK